MEAVVDDNVELTFTSVVSIDNVVDSGMTEDDASFADVRISPEAFVSSSERLLTFVVWEVELSVK